VISRSGLHRRLRNLKNKTVSQYIRDFRMKKALELLSQSSLTVSEIAFKVGFGSVTYFNKCFLDFFGKTPTEARHEGLTWSEVRVAGPPGAIAGEEKNPSASRKILFGSLWVVLLILTGWSLSKLFEDDAVPGKTITVLPFRDDSSDQENSYILRGLREEILNNLKTFSPLEVVSLIASQNYDYDEKKSAREIGQDLKADYILTGSAQTIRGKCRVRLHLIETATDKDLWAMPYEGEVTIDNIFEFQKEVAMAVADELGIIISPEVKEKIGSAKPPTNPTAYNNYLKARNIIEAFLDPYNEEPMQEARRLLELSLKYDSTFALSYVGLGWYYFGKGKSADWKQRRIYCDSLHQVADKAIHYDPKYRDAYSLKSAGYAQISRWDEAIDAAKETIKLDPEDPDSYRKLAYCYFMTNRLAEAARNDLMAYKLNKEPLPDKWNLGGLNSVLRFSGFFELADQFNKMHLAQENDSTYYYSCQRDMFIHQCRPMDALEVSVLKLKYMTDTTNVFRFLAYATYYLWDHNMEEMNRYFHLFLEEAERKKMKIENSRYSSEIGYMFKLNGNQSKSDSIFQECEKRYEELWNLGYNEKSNGGFETGMAINYASWGKPEKSLEYLRALLRFEAIPLYILSWMKMLPQFDTMRQMPEFQALLTEFEARYNREREKVRKIFVRAGFTP